MSNIVAGSNNESGNKDGVGKDASFNNACGIAIDQKTGSLFVSDQGNHTIRKITPQGNFFILLFCCD
jgi:DNA-binding beta-propeller fold protein YncE